MSIREPGRLALPQKETSVWIVLIGTPLRRTQAGLRGVRGLVTSLQAVLRVRRELDHQAFDHLVMQYWMSWLTTPKR
jgi:hypothetical protein